MNGVPLASDFHPSHETDLEAFRPHMVKVGRAYGGQSAGSREDWETPPEVFGPLNAEFGFALDVCANHVNTKCPEWFDKEDDALKHEWRGRFPGPWWMNPPYGRGIIGQWVEKAHHEAQAGRWGVALLPCYTGNDWWIDTVMQYEVRYCRGKIHFIGAEHNAMFWNAVVVFRVK